MFLFSEHIPALNVPVSWKTSQDHVTMSPCPFVPNLLRFSPIDGNSDILVQWDSGTIQVWQLGFDRFDA